MKLHRVCVALGLITGDVLEYATRREVADVPWDISDQKVFALLGEPKSREYAQRFERMSNFTKSIFALAVVCLTSSDPLGQVLAQRISIAPLVEDFPEFALMAAELSNIERLAMLKALHQSPFQKLRAHGLLKLEALQAYIEGNTEWSFTANPSDGAWVPESIKQTLGAHRI